VRGALCDRSLEHVAGISIEIFERLGWLGPGNDCEEFHAFKFLNCRKPKTISELIITSKAKQLKESKVRGRCIQPAPIKRSIADNLRHLSNCISATLHHSEAFESLS